MDSILLQQIVNGLSIGLVYALMAIGFTLIFGLMRIANLTHGAYYMLGAYIGVSILKVIPNLWVAALLGGIAVALLGGLVERFILRKLAGNELGQVLVTLGFAYIIADLCLVVWGGDPIPVPTPEALESPLEIGGFMFPAYRLAVVAIALATGVALYLLMERTRLGAMGGSHGSRSQRDLRPIWLSCTASLAPWPWMRSAICLK